MKLWTLQYLLTASFCFSLSWQFYKAQDGYLRRLMIATYAALGFAFASTSLNNIFTEFGIDLGSGDFVRSASTVPLSIALVLMWIYVRRVQRKQKELRKKK